MIRDARFHRQGDAQGLVDGVALALFGWFRYGGNLPCEHSPVEIFFQSSPLPTDRLQRRVP
jgi:hypothetical protein